jgi:hypothetical protein
MCSITDRRLALIGLAIDELAEAARVAAGDPGPGTPGTTAEGTMTQDSGSQDEMARDTMAHDTMAERVARIWAMVADLDPGLAHRLSQYTDQPTTSQPTTGNTSTGQPTPDPGHA